MSRKLRYYICIIGLVLQYQAFGQQAPAPGKSITNNTETWIGLYTKYRLSEKLFYYGEYNYRRRNQFINDMGQLYLRFGLTYLVNKQFEVTAGIVTPFYWAPNQEAPNIDKVVPQFRFWQQFLLVQPIAWVPQRLELPVRLLAQQREGLNQARVWLRFEPQPASLETALEKHLFRLHRRQLAQRKPA